MALINFSGIASGIDSAALIDAIIEQKRSAQVTPLETKVQDYEDTDTALEELKDLLEELKSAASLFRSLNGGAIAKDAISSNESILTATAANGAASGSYSFNIAQLAANATLSFDDRYASASDKIYAGMDDEASAADRTVTIKTGTGSEQESVDIVLTSSSTVSDFINSFNSQSSKAVASLVNMGSSSSPSYAIVITSNESGSSNGEIADPIVGSAITDSGSGAFLTYDREQASDAVFTMQGITGSITRSSNTVSDVISGVTLNLQATGSAGLTVASNSDDTIAALQDLVDKFNAVVEFIKENDAIVTEEIDGETENIFGPLAKTELDDNLLSALRSALNSAGLSGQSVNILADLGITTERDGTLKFDSDVFKTAFAASPSDVQSILENLGEELAATGGTIDNFTRFNGLFDTTIAANKSAISSIQTRISDFESRLSQEEENLTALYARLESLIGSMQQQQSALQSILPTSS